MPTDISSLIALWNRKPEIKTLITHVEQEQEKAATYADFPGSIAPEVIKALAEHGIRQLYSHQQQAYLLCESGNNIVITTGNASGKSLCYQLPILQSLHCDSEACYLCIFPTKALGHDQHKSFIDFTRALFSFSVTEPSEMAAVYDGDSAHGARQRAKKNARILITNPDMLHVGILPRHPEWARFLANLKYIVLDEIHLYRGIWGSHVANILRRLDRILRFYGASPQYILTTATVANAAVHGEKLTGQRLRLVSDDGSPKGRKTFLMINSPVVNRDLNIRQSIAKTFLPFAADILSAQVQTLYFGQTRKMVENLGRMLRDEYPEAGDQIAIYRSGYLPSQRRTIESQIKKYQVALTVATNALEIGVDIGQLDCVCIGGFPGTISSFRQQGGRAGRLQQSSAVLFFASMSSVDQYLANHPEYLFEKSPEVVSINPDNSQIVHQHLQCSLFELPFQRNESFGTLPLDWLTSFLQVLCLQGKIHLRGDTYYWLADAYPAADISIRSIGGKPYRLLVFDQEASVEIGEVDPASVHWYVHPGAVYIHQGVSYLVQDLNFSNREVILNQKQTDYYTVPVQQHEITPADPEEEGSDRGFNRYYGEINVLSQVIGYKKINWEDPLAVSLQTLEMPPTNLQTYGTWITIAPEIVEGLKGMGLWSSEANSYGKNWEQQKALARKRDQYRCVNCGLPETDQAHAVHHKIPFRHFASYQLANSLDNLVTLCPACHRLAEAHVKTRSGIAGLAQIASNLSSLRLMCDPHDMGWWVASAAPQFHGAAVVLAYDLAPGGIGLAQHLFSQWPLLLNECLLHLESCPCVNGCPSCVGPSGPDGLGCKSEVKALLSLMVP